MINCSFVLPGYRQAGLGVHARAGGSRRLTADVVNIENAVHPDVRLAHVA